MARISDLALEAIPAWSGFVADVKFDAGPAELAKQLCHRRRRVDDLSVLTHLRSLATPATATAIVSLWTSRPPYFTDWFIVRLHTEGHVRPARRDRDIAYRETELGPASGEHVV